MRWPGVSMLAMMVLVLGACGGDGDATTATNSGSVPIQSDGASPTSSGTASDTAHGACGLLTLDELLEQTGAVFDDPGRSSGTPGTELAAELVADALSGGLVELTPDQVGAGASLCMWVSANGLNVVEVYAMSAGAYDALAAAREGMPDLHTLPGIGDRAYHFGADLFHATSGDSSVLIGMQLESLRTVDNTATGIALLEAAMARQ